MDSKLQEIVDIASSRGNQYVKGEATIEQLPEKIAELGVLLLEKAKVIQGIGLSEERLKEELFEIQNKIDDLRKSVFSIKLKTI
ncbi:MAG: hypothetical protein A2X59_11110 [Nitrospirae bacterium GWC2_42_7]|nr:MAG: hypothetical protein A2X59_11110 [Nitrospirae bacterium GWC2_42_7]